MREALHVSSLQRADFTFVRHPAVASWWSMIPPGRSPRACSSETGAHPASSVGEAFRDHALTKMAPRRGPFRNFKSRSRSAIGLLADDHAAIRTTLSHGHRAAAFLDVAGGFTVTAALPVTVTTVRIADPHTDARHFHRHALSRYVRGRNASQQQRSTMHCAFGSDWPSGDSAGRLGKNDASGDECKRDARKMAPRLHPRSSWLSLATRSNASPALLIRY
jgi:hypothetical protein